MIGIMGGTFDPVHHGHLRPALEVAELLALSAVHIIPAKQSPHREQPMSYVAHRLEMVKLAIEHEPRFILDDREFHREGPSYTVDTLRSLKQEYTKNTRFALIMGGDAFQRFHLWKNWEEILELSNLVIAHRPGYELSPLPVWAQNRFTYDKVDFQNSVSGKIYPIEVTQMDISSTFIRKQLAKGKSAHYLLPEKVWHYIRNQQLYGMNPN
jgi:nicotinate-nucleotide adenylyltransferase